jgi:hypothetical protein
MSTHDPRAQAEELATHRAEIIARTAYLDALAGGFRFDQKLDADLSADMQQGIKRRLASLRELTAAVRGYAAKNRWSESWTSYEAAERVFVNADLWIKLGRAEAGASRAARQRKTAARAGGETTRRKAQVLAAETSDAIRVPAKEYRRLHPDKPLSAVIAHLRRLRTLDESDATLRRYLRALGLK